MANLHYFWAGPPAAGKNTGQDTAGPMLSAEQFGKKQQVIFWCLRAHAQHYTALYKAHPNIEVRSIESLEDKYSDQLTRELFTFIKQLKQLAAKTKNPQDLARIYVTIKELMQYYLPIYYDGYFADSTVIPNESLRGMPGDYEEFLFPELHIPGRKRGPKKFADPWCIYSPKIDPLAKKRFAYFLKGIKEAFAKDNPFAVANRFEMGGVFIHTATQHGTKHSAVKTEVAHTRFGLVDFLAFRKFYANTHREFAHLLPPFLHRLIQTKGNIAFKSHLLQAGHVDSSAVYKYQDERTHSDTESTLLHEAVKAKDPETLALLLRYAKTPLQKVTDNRFAFNPMPKILSALDLAHEIKCAECIDVFTAAGYTSKQKLKAKL